MAALNASVKADLLLPAPRTYPTVEIQIPGTTQNYSESEVGALCEPGTMWVGRLLELGPHPSSAANPDKFLELVEFDIVVEDLDRVLGPLLERKEAFGSTVLVRLITAHATTPPRATTFTGVLWKKAREGEMAWRLTFKPDTELPLERPATPLYIDKAILPFAQSDALGLPIPLLYGIHDSWGIGGQGEGGGAITPIFVGQYAPSDFRGLLCLGQNRLISRVLNNGVTHNPANWSHIVETTNGVTLSFVSTTTNIWSGTVTCDVEGYETVGDGTGTIINEATDVLQHLLHHFSGRDAAVYQSGNWYSGWQSYDGMLDLTYRTALRDWLRKRIYCYPRAARYITDDRKLADHVEELLRTFGVRGFWLETGKLAVAADNVDAYDYISTDPEWLDWRKYELAGSPFKLVDEPFDVVKRLFMQHSLVNGSYQRTLEIVSPRASQESAQTIEMPWGPAGA